MRGRSCPDMPGIGTRSPLQDDVLSALRQVPSLASLGTERLVRISAYVRLKQVPRGTLVTIEGHPVDALYIVACGSFKRFRNSPTGREQILALLVTGDTFGEVALLDRGGDFASTQAMQRGAVFAVPADQFRAAIADEPDPLRDVCQTLTMRLRHMVGIIGDLSFCHVVERVAGLIVEETLTPNQPHLTQATMAAMAGTTREVVARTIHELCQSGAITVDRGRISVRDAALLRRIARSDRI
jgi:CRP-like cAMP-binding protein